MTDSISEPMAWYCLRSKTKREHIAAAFVLQQCGVEVFAPRVALWRKTRIGRKIFVEPLFPGYFFAHFSWGGVGRRILATQGVTGVVRFGHKVPLVPDSVVEDLRLATAKIETSEGERGPLEEGDIVEVLSGCFKGSTAVVHQPVSGGDRVSVLIDFLGRSLTLNVSRSSILVCGEDRVVVPGPLLRSCGA